MRAATSTGAPSRLLDGERAQRTWDGGYAGNAEGTIWARLPFVDRAAEAIAEGAPGPVLELPCGGGANTPLLAARLPVVLAADRSKAAIELANRTTEASNSVFVQADVYELLFSSNSFGGVFCADLMGHLEHPVQALRELVRVCRPGGRIAVNFFDATDPCRLDPEMRPLAAPRSYMYRDILFRFDSVDLVMGYLRQLPVRVLEIDSIRWEEEPHPGYRDYEHEHHSVLAILEVQQ
jgi:SAM-dependent methyltransferase